MPRYRVSVETATTVTHQVTVEATDPEAAKVAAEGMVDEIEEEGQMEGPPGSDYRESGIGGWTTAQDVGEIDGDGEVHWHGHRCLDCGVDKGWGVGIDVLMLKPEVWKSIVPDGEGMLCRTHMETRLGRPLTRDDLWDVEGGNLAERLGL